MTTEITSPLTLTDTATLPLTNISEMISRQGLPPVQGHTTIDEYQQMRADILNEAAGGLDGCDCEICRNKGIIYAVSDGEIITRDCDCMPKRRSVWAMKYSGLGDLLKCGFDNFTVAEEWQDKLKRGAMRYAETNDGEWLLCAGQNGAGKTHICTAVCKRFMERGYKVRYELWSDIYRRLSANKFDDSGYGKYFDELMKAEILYIDDFLKVRRGRNEAGKLSDAEIKAAYDVINSRSLARDTRKRTIISTEYTLDELRDIDIATAGRIKARAGVYMMQIARDAARDYRFKR